MTVVRIKYSGGVVTTDIKKLPRNMLSIKRISGKQYPVAHIPPRPLDPDEPNPGDIPKAEIEKFVKNARKENAGIWIFAENKWLKIVGIRHKK